MSIDAFALFGEKAGQQLVGLTAGDSSSFSKMTNKLIEILGQFFQFDLLLGRTQSEPAFGFLCMPLLNCVRVPLKSDPHRDF